MKDRNSENASGLKIDRRQAVQGLASLGLGALAVAVMLFFPAGLWGALAERFGWRLFPVQRRLIVRDRSVEP